MSKTARGRAVYGGDPGLSAAFGEKPYTVVPAGGRPAPSRTPGSGNGIDDVLDPDSLVFAVPVGSTTGTLRIEAGRGTAENVSFTQPLTTVRLKVPLAS